MSTTPEDNKPAAESTAAEAPAPTTATAPSAPQDKGRLCKIVAGVVALLLVVFVALHFVNQGAERTRVYGEGRPTDELGQLRTEQRQFLDGRNPTGKTLDQAMADALR